jgi:perosamine synthetase
VLGPEVSIKRDELIDELSKKGIETRPVFYPMHHMPPYFDDSLRLPIAERLSYNGISLPTHGDLTQSDIEFVSATFTDLVLNSQ